ncbi:IclR family transcriptional regulator [Saccharopolyspora cebuensis]
MAAEGRECGVKAESTVPEQAGSGPSVVKSADRALVILELLSRGRHRLSDIAEILHLPLSSVHGLLGTLVHRGFAEFDQTTRTYGLGLKAWTVGQGYTGHRGIVGLALPLMEGLAAETEETVQLSRLDGTENVYIAIAESPQPMKLVSAVGMRLPAHAVGLGKALLSGLSPEEWERRYRGVRLERFTDSTVTDLDALRAEVEGVRELGYAVDDEEYIVGCRCVAMPIRDHTGEVVAALSVSAPTPRCGPDWTERTRRPLAEVVAAVEEQLRR